MDHGQEIWVLHTTVKSALSHNSQNSLKSEGLLQLVESVIMLQMLRVGRHLSLFRLLRGTEWEDGASQVHGNG